VSYAAGPYMDVVAVGYPMRYKFGHTTEWQVLQAYAVPAA
jgi:hypothetical protein